MTAPREITGIDRMTVAGIADALIEADGPGCRKLADKLLAAVRCCGFFPECSHVLGWIEERDASLAAAGLGETPA